MIRLILKLFVQSAAIALAMILVARKPMVIEDIIKVTLVTTAVLAVLAIFAPDVAPGASTGIGMGMGLSQVGMERYANIDALEFFDGQRVMEGFDEDAKVTRLNNVLYSGDLILISGGDPGKTDGQFIQRSITTNEIILNDPVDTIHTNLSKLRFELTDHDPTTLKPLHYGDTVFIKHNANIENINQSKFVEISDNLLSHQDGPLFNQFQVFSAASPGDTSYLRPDTPVVIKNLKSGGIAEGYLTVGDNKKFTNKATDAAGATKLSIALQRVVERGDAHLGVAVGEVLYP